MMLFDFTTPSALTTSLRQFANVIGGILVGSGLVSESQFQIWSGLAISLAVSGFAVWKQFKMRGAK